MPGQVSDEVMEAAIVIVAILTLLVLIYYSAIALNPRMTLNPFPPPAPSPLALAVPTFPPTWTPMPTATSTPTTLPTLAPTVTPLPPPTATSMPRPTPQPVPPTATPTVTPTPTPALWFSVVGTRSYPNCGSLGVQGFVWDKAGNLKGGVAVKVWAEGWEGGTTTSSSGYVGVQGDRNYEFRLYSPGWYFVAVVKIETGELLSPPVSVNITPQLENCQPGQDGSQWVRVDFRED